MFRKINEVLFRNERMCATRFSTSGVAFLRMTVRRHVELRLFVFYVTCNDSSVIYVTEQMCRRTEEGRCTYGPVPNAIDISQGSLTCPSYTDTGPPFLYGDSDTPPNTTRWGFGGRILDLNPRRPHGV